MNEELVNLETEEVVVDVSEVGGWASGNASLHNNLAGRDAEGQHPIKSIIGLREELDKIEKLKTVYSDKLDTATYYKWGDARYETGYFVTVIPDTSTVTICDETSPIFGVTVDDAGFIGGQDEENPRGDDYALVVTSGLVDVRCDSNVVVGDCVVSNKSGEATATVSKHGYKVVAIVIKDGVRYASIMLGIQADVTNDLSLKLEYVTSKLEVAEAQIIQIGSRTDAAYDKSATTEESNKTLSDKVTNIESDMSDIKNDVEISNQNSKDAKEIAEQSKAIADSTLTSAQEYCNEAISKASEAWSLGNGIKEDEYSLRVSIDKYSVGEYSQAYGLTLEQAKNILESGMIYVPTYEHNEEYKYTVNVETVPSTTHIISTTKVYYVDSDDDNKGYWYSDDGVSYKRSATLPIYTRKFSLGNVYKWGEIPNGNLGWITIDQNNVNTDYGETSAPNVAYTSVYFTPQEPHMSQASSFGYWYTNGDPVLDKEGNKTKMYQPYTLYKWEKTYNENQYVWVPKATLAGNVLNRTIGVTNLTANEASLEVSNARGSMAAMQAKLTETEAKVDNIAKWVNTDGSSNVGVVRTVANEDGSGVILAVQHEKDGDTIEYAGLTLIQNGKGTGAIVLDAADVLINGETILTDVNGQTKISGGMIDANSLTVNSLSVEDNSGNDILIASKNSVYIGGWDVKNNGFYNGDGVSYYISFGMDNYFEKRGLWLYTGNSNFSVGMPPQSEGTLDFSVYNAKSNVGLSICDDDCGVFRGDWRHDGSLDFVGKQYYNSTPVLTINHNGVNVVNGQSWCRLIGQDDKTSFMEFDIYNYNVDTGISIDDDAAGTIRGSWTLIGNIASDEGDILIGSDRNIKNSIEIINENYNVLFDNLNPVIYKYNNGKSGRYHTGFIAQDVKNAMDIADISSQDFAALCIGDDKEEIWRLRYSEFIALNTWQIQMLKARVAELEEKIDNMN